MSFFTENAGFLQQVTSVLCNELNRCKESGMDLVFEKYQPYLGEQATERGHIKLTVPHKLSKKFNVLGKLDYLDLPRINKLINPYEICVTSAGAEINVTRVAEQIAYVLAKQNSIKLDAISLFQIAHEAENQAAVKMGLFHPKNFLSVYPARDAG